MPILPPLTSYLNMNFRKSSLCQQRACCN